MTVDRDRRVGGGVRRRVARTAVAGAVAVSLVVGAAGVAGAEKVPVATVQPVVVQTVGQSVAVDGVVDTSQSIEHVRGKRGGKRGFSRGFGKRGFNNGFNKGFNRGFNQKKFGFNNQFRFNNEFNNQFNNGFNSFGRF